MRRVLEVHHVLCARQRGVGISRYLDVMVVRLKQTPQVVRESTIIKV